MYAQGRLLYVHTPKVLGCTPPAIIRHFSFRSAPCHDIRRFTGHMRTKSHIGVYPLSTLPMPNTTAAQDLLFQWYGCGTCFGGPAQRRPRHSEARVLFQYPGLIVHCQGDRVFVSVK